MFKNILDELTSIYAKELSLVESNVTTEEIAILKHLNFVTEELKKLKKELKIIEITPKTKPVVSYLNEISPENKTNNYQKLTKHLKKLSSKLYWRYGYQNPSPEMIEKYAYTEVIGPEGPIYSENLIIGFVLLAPNFYYPKHRHTEIEESYLFLNGKTFYNEQLILAERSFILNKAGRVHELKSGLEKPTLILYSWKMAGDGSLKDYQLNLD